MSRTFLLLWIQNPMSERSRKANLKNEETFRDLQKSAKEHLEQSLKEGIRNAQHIGSDIFGFGEAFHRKFPREWHSWKEDWSQNSKRLKWIFSSIIV